MAFGSVRKPYSARANFFANGSVADNRINWYIVPDDTPRYEGFTAFYPRVIHPPDKSNTIFEEEGAGKFVRRFDWNILFVPPPAHAAHGDDDDFQGRSLREKYFIDDVAPEPVCAVVRMDPAAFEVSAKVLLHEVGESAGIRLGAALQALAPRTYTAGLRLGGVLLAPAPHTYTAGIALGATCNEVQQPQAGIALNATLREDLPEYVLTDGTCAGAFQAELGILYVPNLAGASPQYFDYSAHVVPGGVYRIVVGADAGVCEGNVSKSDDPCFPDYVEVIDSFGNPDVDVTFTPPSWTGLVVDVGDAGGCSIGYLRVTRIA